MEYSEILNSIRNYLHKTLTCLSPERINAILDDQCTTNFFSTDKEVQRCSLNQIKNIISVYENGLRNLFEELGFDLFDENQVISENLEGIFKNSGIHIGKLNQLKFNFEMLENWIIAELAIINQYTEKDLKTDLESCVIFTFLNDAKVIDEVLANTQLSDITDKMELRQKALDILLTEDEDNKEKLITLISTRIIEKAVSIHKTTQLSYYWLKKLQNRELTIQTYSELENCPIFSPLFV